MLGLAFTVSAASGAGTLVYGTTDKVTDMDPANAYDFHTWEIFQNTMDGLVGYAPGGSTLVPALATSWTSNAAGDEFTFKLRKGVKFSDGTPFDANVVKWTIDRNAALDGRSLVARHGFREVGRGRGSADGEVHPEGPRGLLPHARGQPSVLPLNPNIFPGSQGQVREGPQRADRRRPGRPRARTR